MPRFHLADDQTIEAAEIAFSNAAFDVDWPVDRLRDNCRCLQCSHHRAGNDAINVRLHQCCGCCVGLRNSCVIQWRVGDALVATLPVPIRLAMSQEEELSPGYHRHLAGPNRPIVLARAATTQREALLRTIASCCTATPSGQGQSGRAAAVVTAGAPNTSAD